MDRKRGPNKKVEVTFIAELGLEPMARHLQIPISQLEREYEAGEWNGAFKLRGEAPFFIVHLVMEKQKEQALKSMTIRKKAA